jgi:hypothetical protein
MNVDLPVSNASTKKAEWPMPNLKDELHDLHGSVVFATLDFVRAIGRYLCTKRLSRLSVVHHAGWSTKTDACTAWNEESYATSAVRASRHDG